ncbi:MULTISPECIES: DUF6199 family natural product biosynthesis protein [unclassified Streptomyces]|uniref:DUF6199 family natural product biosynthesis protein n=1 Tax=unclassified Streptomyces TaxID=2593676 RepID=UPI0036F1664E
MLVVVACIFLVMGVLQVFRPQLLWRANRRLQEGWVRDPAGTEPTARGYAVQRIIGVVFLAVAVWVLIQQL